MLCKSETAENVTEQNAFLDQLTFQKISDDEKSILDSPLKAMELYGAIGNINSGKAPGPDGFKIFQMQLVKPLLDMYKESFTVGTLPDSLRLALITLILKPNKPPTKCSSYRPIR